MPPFCDKHQMYFHRDERDLGMGLICDGCEHERYLAAIAGPTAAGHRCQDCHSTRVLIASMLGYDVQQAAILDPVAMVRAHLNGEPHVPAARKPWEPPQVVAAVDPHAAK